MNKLSRIASCVVCTAAFCYTAQVSAAPPAPTILHVDASAPLTIPKSAHLHLNDNALASVAPNGSTLAINNKYLLRDGKPWLPVMGEFHYSRSPASSWEAELRKMKSAGIDIVSSYVIWNHHEPEQGQFNWQGNRDLKRFIQLCAKTGLQVVVRIGPWAHAEVRFGGVPDWVVNAIPIRSDDAQYLHFVELYYQQIAAQLQGQLWKQGGPVIGIQIENEFNLTGAGQGAGHIHNLKLLAQKAGMDVPLYTVTGWDATVYPQGEVVPVFGGYPDEPWSVSQKELPPKETYAFRFGSRVSGDLGAQTVASSAGTADSDTELTPFLGAEYGAGLPAMYRRRTLVSADDIVSMLPVQLGSGVNLLGYYMFHGGRNPLSAAGTGMQESTLSGGYNDTPMINYDFQAPLGPDGQQREVLERMRPFHYFLQDFGARLAPMEVRKPDLVPANEAELSTLRWSVRSAGNSGFLFVNNHVRQYPMAVHKQVQFSVQLPGQTLVFPEHGVDIADDSYFIWPLNMDLDGVNLRYATAQPVARLDQGKAGVTYVFSAVKNIPLELGFNSSVAAYLTAPHAQKNLNGEYLTVSLVADQAEQLLKLTPPNSRPVTILILSPEQTSQLTIGQFASQRRLILSRAQVEVSNDALRLHSAGENQFQLALFPALEKSLSVQTRPSQKLPQSVSLSNGFQGYSAAVPAYHFKAGVQQIRAAKEASPVLTGGAAKAALEPRPESFGNSAAWRIDLPFNSVRAALASGNVDEVLLDIAFTGDVGRLFSGVHLLDDWYYTGNRWQYGLKKMQEQKSTVQQPLTLAVLPLRADAPIYIPKEFRPDFAGQSQLAVLHQINLIPVYQLNIFVAH